jgi:type I restriction enzyme, S subunit
MSDLSAISIGEGCDILDNLRVPLNSDERDGIHGEVPYYGANGLQGFIDKYIFDEPLILMAEDGGYFDEYQTRPIAYKISGRSWVNNHAHVLRTKKGGPLDQEFVFYCLEHKYVMPFIKGGTRAKLNQSELREITIPKPQKCEQRRIAEILSTVDETIEQTEALIAKQQQMKAGLMHDLFTRGVTLDGHLRPTRTEAPHLYQNSPLGWIPKEWRVRPFQSVLTAKLQNGYFKKPELVGRGYKLVNVSELYQPFGIDAERDDVERVEAGPMDLQKYGVLEGDLFFTRSSLVLSGIAQCNVVLRLREPTLFECHVIRARPDTKEMDPAFLALYFQTSRARSELMGRAKHTTMTTISQPDILAVPVLQPPLSEQKLISKRIAASLEAIKKGEASLSKLRQQKQGLMHDLLTGRVLVEVEEPLTKMESST